MIKKIKRFIISPFRTFIKHEASSGVILLIFAVMALVIANSPGAAMYNHILHSYLSVGFGKYSISMSLLHWINDGLMAIFFFVVGMEIKRELVVGELKSIKKAMLPIAAAVGGMVVPALIYAAFNFNKTTISGWGIPMATDIAFALGILSLVGVKRAPRGIVVFLTALAIVDDLGAIVVIAIFYTSNISVYAFFGAIVILIILMALNTGRVNSIPVFLIFGIVLWICILKSGIHASVAGVLLGMTIPLRTKGDSSEKSMLQRLEHTLTPWSAYVIMPIFALANSGVSIKLDSIPELISSPISLGIIGGLFIGKQFGIFATAYLLIRLKVANLPSRVTIRHIYGASVLGGIGFTMSLFIASLSFTDGNLLATAKISIITASILSALYGISILRFNRVVE